MLMVDGHGNKTGAGDGAMVNDREGESGGLATVEMGMRGFATGQKGNDEGNVGRVRDCESGANGEWWFTTVEGWQTVTGSIVDGGIARFWPLH